MRENGRLRLRESEVHAVFFMWVVDRLVAHVNRDKKVGGLGPVLCSLVKFKVFQVSRWIVYGHLVPVYQFTLSIWVMRIGDGRWRGNKLGRTKWAWGREGLMCERGGGRIVCGNRNIHILQSLKMKLTKRHRLGSDKVLSEIGEKKEGEGREAVVSSKMMLLFSGQQ